MKTLRVLVVALIAVGCATNPATGRRQLILMSEAEEIQSRRANGIPLHKEVLQWFAECTREMGLAPLAAMR